jgi:hypothetical protein
LERRIVFVRPSVPAFLSEVRISKLALPDAVADLLVVRDGDDISVQVLRQEGNLEVEVLP